MRNLLAFLALVMLTVSAVGWYLGWYKVRRSPSPDGEPSVTVDFDTRKIGADLGKAQKAIQKKLAEQANKHGNPDKPADGPAVPMNVEGKKGAAEVERIEIEN